LNALNASLSLFSLPFWPWNSCFFPSRDPPVLNQSFCSFLEFFFSVHGFLVFLLCSARVPLQPPFCGFCLLFPRCLAFTLVSFLYPSRRPLVIGSFFFFSPLVVLLTMAPSCVTPAPPYCAFVLLYPLLHVRLKCPFFYDYSRFFCGSRSEQGSRSLAIKNGSSPRLASIKRYAFHFGRFGNGYRLPVPI